MLGASYGRRSCRLRTPRSSSRRPAPARSTAAEHCPADARRRARCWLSFSGEGSSLRDFRLAGGGAPAGDRAVRRPRPNWHCVRELATPTTSWRAKARHPRLAAGNSQPQAPHKLYCPPASHGGGRPPPGTTGCHTSGQFANAIPGLRCRRFDPVAAACRVMAGEGRPSPAMTMWAPHRAPSVWHRNTTRSAAVCLSTRPDRDAPDRHAGRATALVLDRLRCAQPTGRPCPGRAQAPYAVVRGFLQRPSDPWSGSREPRGRRLCPHRLGGSACCQAFNTERTEGHGEPRSWPAARVSATAKCAGYPAAPTRVRPFHGSDLPLRSRAAVTRTTGCFISGGGLCTSQPRRESRPWPSVSVRSVLNAWTGANRTGRRGFPGTVRQVPLPGAERSALTPARRIPITRASGSQAVTRSPPRVGAPPLREGSRSGASAVGV